MKLLYTSTYPPFPMTNGQTLRSMSLLRSLVDSGHAVTFASFVSPKLEAETFQMLSSLCENVILVPHELATLSASKGFRNRLAALVCCKSYAIERFRCEPMKAVLGHYLQSFCFDAVVADSLYALTNLPPTRIPLVLNCHNVEWMILNRYARLERNPLRRAYVNVEQRRMLIAEKSACEKSAVCMVCSEQDAALLRGMVHNAKICVVPNCVDTLAYAPRHFESDAAPTPTILFQGGMDWYPNRDAVEHFVRRIFPSVLEQFPDARFVVVGRNPSVDFIRRISACGNVDFTGTVKDVRPYLAKTTLAVVPLRIGSGTRLKILEAAAAGLAIVSTTLGAEGLQFKPGQDIVLADQPAHFATAIIDLLSSAERRRSIGVAARKKVVEQYSFTCLRALVGKCLSAIHEMPDTPPALHD